MKKVSIAVAFFLQIAGLPQIPCLVNAQDLCKPVGWATQNGGVTGGAGTSPVTVSTYADLKSALTSSTGKVVYISGAVAIPSGGRITIQDQTGKTIIGLAGSKMVSTDLTKENSGILYIKRCKNFIMRNLVFEGPGAYDVDGYDNLCIDNCQNFWVDHCEFHDGMDGNFDIKNMSDFVSITWCKFSYEKASHSGGSGGADDHRFSNLIGSSDDATDDDGKLNITFNYCWWAQGCVERMPRMRFGKLHMANNLFNSTVSNQCIRAGYKADILAQGNYFDKQKLPIDEFDKDYTAIKAVNNYGQADMTKNAAFTPPYTLTIANPADIFDPIKSCAGATMNNPTGCSTCGKDKISDNHNPVGGKFLNNSISVLNVGNVLTISTDNKSIINSKQPISIMNMLGKTIIRRSFSNKVDVGRLEHGVYLLKISDYSFKFIKETSKNPFCEQDRARNR